MSTAEMATAKLKEQSFFVESWLVEPRLHRISAGGDVRQLDPRTMDVLVCLASRAGDLVRRDELVGAVWGEDTFVAENTISQSISRLRRAFDDDWRHPSFVETISKSGYRLIAPVEPDAATDAPTAVTTARPSRSKTLFMASVSATAALLLLTGAAIWSRASLRTRDVPAPLDPKPAVTRIGYELHEALSPDGSRLAFAWGGDAEYGTPKDIYVKEIGAENEVRLTSTPADERYPAWSPDGKSVAFLRRHEDACTIVRAAVLGGAEEKLYDCVWARGLDWSADGRWLAFAAATEDDRQPRILLLDLESHETRTLTRAPEGVSGDVDPKFSPDGDSVAFMRVVNEYWEDLYVVPTSGGEPRRVTRENGMRLWGHAWMPDSRELVYASDRDGRMALWHHLLDGGEPVRLGLGGHWNNTPAIARERPRLAFRQINDVVDLWVLELGEDGQPTGEPSMVASSTRSEMNPRVSPDGERLAFVSNRSGRLEVWSADRRGEALIRHTDGYSRVSAPVWSPDGKTLVFDASAEGHKDLYAVGRDGRKPRRLTRDASLERNAAYSRDARHLYFASDRSGSWQIWKMPAGGGRATRVTDEGGFRAVEGPAGRFLYYSKRDDVGIWRRPLAGGAEERLVENLHPYDWGSWEVSRLGIYFVERWPTHLAFYRFADGETLRLWKADKEISYSPPAMSLADDGRTLVFAKVRTGEDEIMVVDLDTGR